MAKLLRKLFQRALTLRTCGLQGGGLVVVRPKDILCITTLDKYANLYVRGCEVPRTVTTESGMIAARAIGAEVEGDV